MKPEPWPRFSSGSRFWLAVVLLFLLGVFLRVFRVHKQLLLDDEWHALNAVQNQDFSWIFGHLGHADHSIPLTLYFELLSQTSGLSELAMRMPALAAGIAAIVVLPWLWRRWMQQPESLMFIGLLSISPFLVNYSRIARPYSLLALFSGAAVILAWNWWQSIRSEEPVRVFNRSGFAWMGCTAIAAWLNPVSLAVTCGPFLWFGMMVIRDRTGLTKILPGLIGLGLGITALVTALLYLPLSNDFASLSIKTGTHTVSAGTFAEVLTLFSGTGNTILSIALLVAAGYGWKVLLQRDRSFAGYLGLIAAAATIAVTLTGAAWISYGLVLGRYLIGLLPLFLALVAIGLVQLGAHIVSLIKSKSISTEALFAAALLGMFFAGPLPSLNAGQNQFTHHMAYQFDYDAGRNPVRQALEPVLVEPFYTEIAHANPDGTAVVVETPWFLESNWNALPFYQLVHGQEVRVGFLGGVCAQGLYGELEPATDGMDFRNFVFVERLLSGAEKADYLVFRTAQPAGARDRQIDFNTCENSIRAELGEPWRATENALVFRLNSDF